MPESARVHETVDFAAILPHVAAAIHHGGAGTTHALVTHAIPQIVVPHAGDQLQQALGVVRTGVGAHVPARAVTPQLLADALAQLLPAKSPQRAKAQSLRAEFAGLGGADAAADLLENEAINAQRRAPSIHSSAN